MDWMMRGELDYFFLFIFFDGIYFSFLFSLYSRGSTMYVYIYKKFFFFFLAGGVV